MTAIRISHVIGYFDADSGGAQQVIKGICEGLTGEGIEHSVIYLFGQATLASALPHEVSICHVKAIGQFYRPKWVKMRQALRALKPDIVHVHSLVAGLVARPTARLENIPSITTVHNTKFAYGLRHYLSELATLPLSSGVIGVSDLVTQHITPCSK